MHARDVVGVLFRRTRVVGRDQQLVVRDEPRRAVDRLGVRESRPAARGGPAAARPRAVDARARNGNAEQKEAEQDGQLVPVAEPSQVGRKLGRAREQLVAGGEPLLDSVRLVAGGPQQPRELDGRLRALRRGGWAPG